VLTAFENCFGREVRCQILKTQFSADSIKIITGGQLFLHDAEGAETNIRLSKSISVCGEKAA
jgi:hypothetical protein